MFRKFNYRESTPFTFKQKSLTEQHHASECDINRIVRRYETTGILPSGVEGQYLEVDHLQGNLTEMMNKTHQILDSHYAEQRELEEQQRLQKENEYQQLQEKAKAFDKLQENKDNENS